LEDALLFHPPFCPISGCPSEFEEVPFRYHRHGRYRRACDGAWVQRFRCSVCERSFSTQTFKSNYRYHIPFLHHLLTKLLCSKITRRQAARVLSVNRKTVERRFARMAEVSADFHVTQLRKCREQGGTHGIFQLDELETFEHNRKLKPVTMSVLIERRSYFVVHARAGTLPARGRRKPSEAKRLAEIQAVEGKRRSQSRACIQRSFEALNQLLAPEAPVLLQSDMKRTYPTECRRATWGRPFIHKTTSSRTHRDYRNLLFPVNHTLAMMRDGMSCLVRRNWAASKTIRGLQRHTAIWMAYRNYVRGVTIKTKTTPAEEAGVCARGWSLKEVLRWRWPSRMSAE
jgi:transposase-like protein